MTEERSRSPRRRLIGLIALLLIVCAGALAYPFARYVRSYGSQPGSPAPLSSEAGREALREIALASPGRLLQSFQPESLPKLRLEIKPKHFEKIAKKRQEALQRKFLISSADDYVPARLHYAGRELKVRVRLKGDLTDHLLGEKWSYRVAVRGDDSVLGMSRFSVQAPYTRDHQAEPLFLDFLRELGVLAPRYFFVDWSVNGSDLGRMAIEEHFATELLESQQRREGVIVRFDEQHFYAAEAGLMSLVPDYDNWRNTPLDVFRGNRVAKSATLSAQRDAAFGLLRGLADGKLRPSDALDIDAWARFLAACEVWSRPHLTHWNNLRMYLNPFSLRLEPIGFDAAGEEADIPAFHCMGGAHSMMTALVADPAVRAAFLERLHEVARQVSTPEFAQWLEAREALYLPSLLGEFPWLEPTSLAAIRERASILLRISEANFEQHLPLAPERVMPHAPDAAYPTVVHAALRRDGDAAFVEFASAISRPVTVTSLWAERQGERRALVGGPDASGEVYVPLSPTAWPEIPKRARLEVKLPELSPKDWSLVGEARVGDQIIPFAVLEGFAPATGPLLPESTLEETLAHHPFLRSDGTEWLVAAPGELAVVGSLILPTGVGLRLGPGTTLRFERGELLLARGPLEFTGTAEAPVVLTASADSWSGVVQLGHARPSRWSHVVVRNTEAVARGPWQLTGGVTFRRTRVELENCSFEDSSAEDALNLVRSEVSLRRVDVTRTASDAIDFDFCSGRAEGGRVARAGGDGLDAAGSQLEFRDVDLSDIGDKAISVGEDSQVRASEIRAIDCGSGVASKDASHVWVGDSSFEGIRVAGLMAYTKKSAYGPATLEAERVTITGRGRRALAQTGSRITIDSELIPSEALDVEALYNPEEAAQ